MITRRDLAQRLEAGLVWLLFQALRRLSLDQASAVGGWIGRTIGPRLRVSRRALANLARIFPDLSPERHRAILRGMWDNLGRNAGEFPHLQSLAYDDQARFTLLGREHIEAARDDNRPGLFFSGHLGNWEIALPWVRHVGIVLHPIYRAANNPHLDWLYAHSRADGSDPIPKGAAGARKAITALLRGDHLGMLVDQKMNDGLAVPFFGIPAMTAPAIAAFALRFRCPVIPWRIIRTNGAHFTLLVEPPLALPDSGDRAADSLALMTSINQILERWIRETPEQWLWLHRRWPNP